MESTRIDPIVHGKNSSYTHKKCRCDLCKQAMREYQLAYKEKNRQKILDRDRAYYSSNREYRKAWQREWNKNNSEHRREYGKQDYLKNRERYLASAKAWASENSEARESHRSKRKASLRSAGVYKFTGRDWIRVQRRFGMKCSYCGSAEKLTQDHVVPVSRGGTHSVGNIVPCCGSCNSSKGNKLLVEWRRDSKIYT